MLGRWEKHFLSKGRHRQKERSSWTSGTSKNTAVHYTPVAEHLLTVYKVTVQSPAPQKQKLQHRATDSGREEGVMSQEATSQAKSMPAPSCSQQYSFITGSNVAAWLLSSGLCPERLICPQPSQTQVSRVKQMTFKVCIRG